MQEQPPLLAAMERRVRDGQISPDEYAAFKAAFKKEWAAYMRLQERLQIIEEVAQQIVEREDAEAKRRSDQSPSDS